MQDMIAASRPKTTTLLAAGWLINIGGGWFSSKYENDNVVTSKLRITFAQGVAKKNNRILFPIFE